MDVNKNSRQVERLEIVETGRRRRWSEDEKLKIVFEPSASRPDDRDGAPLWDLTVAALRPYVAPTTAAVS
jgi:hypothetical protein